MAKRVIGATIKLDGEAEFRRSVSACNSSLKTMKSELALVTEQFKGEANSLDALTAKHEALDKVLKSSESVVEETAKALENAQSNYKRAGDSLDEYKKQLTEAEKALEELKKSETASADEIEEQQKQVDLLTSAVSKGESAYERAGKSVETWQQKLNRSQTEVYRLERELKENDKYLLEAKNSSDGFATSIDSMGKVVKQSAGTAGTAVKQLGDDVGTYFTADKIQEYADKVSDAFAQMTDSIYDAVKEIEGGYDTIVKKTGASGKKLDEYKGAFDNIYGDLPVESQKVGDAIGEVATQFDNLPTDKVEKFSKQVVKFAEITDSDIPNSVSGLQSVMKAYNADVSQLPVLMDVIAKAGQDYGITSDKVIQSLIQNSAALREMNADMYQSVDFVAKLEKSGVDSQAFLSGLKRAFTQSAKEGKDFQTTLLEVQDVLVNSTNKTEAYQKAQELFGRSFPNIAQAVKDGRINFEELAQSEELVADATGTVNSTFEGTEHSWDKVNTAVNNLNEVLYELGGDLLETAVPAIEEVTKVLQEVNDVMDEIPDSAKLTVGAIGGIVLVAGQAAPKVLALVTTLKALKAAGAVETLATAGTAAEGAAAGTAALGSSLAAIAGPAAMAAGALAALIAAANIYSDVMIKNDKNLQSLMKISDSAVEKSTSKLEGYQGRLEALKATPVTSDSKSSAEQLTKEIDAQYKELQQAKEKAEKKYEKEQSKLKDRGVIGAGVTTVASFINPMAGGAALAFTGTDFLKSTSKSKDAIKDLDDQMKELEKTKKEAQKESERQAQKYKAEAEALEQQGAAVTFSKEATQEQKEKALDTLTTYQQLIGLIQTYHGDVEAVRSAIGEDDEALQAVFDRTLGMWQSTHDEIMNGLSDEVATLADNARQWQEYKDSVEESIKAPASMFEEMDYDDSKFWDGMVQAMETNTGRYEQFNENVKSILESTRYQTDETFREIANRIMSGGIENAGYLNTFVDNVDMSIREASDDIAAFADFSGVTDTYAGNLANLQTATEEGMGAIAKAYDDTKTEAEQAMESLSDQMEKQAQIYEDYSKNVESITQSDRYKTDEDFQQFANMLLSQGIAGAENISALWDAMNEGSSSSVDTMMESFTKLKESAGDFADVSSSIKISLQDGMDGAVQIVHDSGESMKLEMSNNSDLIAAGLDPQPLYDKMSRAGATSAQGTAEQMVETFQSDEVNKMLETVADSLGVSFGKTFADSAVATIKDNLNNLELTNNGTDKKTDKEKSGDTYNLTVNGADGISPGELLELAKDKLISAIKNAG